MDNKAVPQIRQSLIYREKDSVLFDTERGQLIELNETANQILQLTLEKVTVEEIVAKLKLIYPEETEESIYHHVSTFLQQAREVSIIEF